MGKTKRRRVGAALMEGMDLNNCSPELSTPWNCCAKFESCLQTLDFSLWLLCSDLGNRAVAEVYVLLQLLQTQTSFSAENIMLGEFWGGEDFRMLASDC